MADEWLERLQALNDYLTQPDRHLGTREERRSLLTQQVGPLYMMSRLGGSDLKRFLGGRPLVGVDGSINTFGTQYPYYIDLIRAIAKPSHGKSLLVKDVHCPIPMPAGGDEEQQARKDSEERQRKLADLEVQVALQAVKQYRPAILLMDGPLVRLDMRTKDSFFLLRKECLRNGVLLLGCIENIESRVVCRVLGEAVPPGWAGRYDRDLLWDALDYGEVLEVCRPAKGLPTVEGEEPRPIRTWFMRASYEPGVVGLDMLEEQAGQVHDVVDYLFTLSPADGRGIPIWLDLVDREVRLTNVEMEAYLHLLDGPVKRIFAAKREGRFF